MIHPILRVVLGLPGAVLAGVGVGWLLVPTLAAAAMSMELVAPAGRSTQIADLGSFFMTLGGCILTGAITGNRLWLAPSLAMLILAICGRTLAWLFHGAALAYDMIAVEVVVSALLAAALLVPASRAS
jgi:hypothetical protein